VRSQAEPWTLPRRSCRRRAPGRAASASWPAHLLHDRSVEVYKSTVRLRFAPTGGDVSGVSDDRPTRCSRSQVWIAPERSPMIGTWPSAPSCGSDAVDGVQRSILFDTVRWTCIRITRSESMKMPRFLTDVTGETWTPSIDNAVVGRWCCRRSVVHQRTSVLSEFNCSLLDGIQLETTPMHSESFAENASISTGRQEPYTWVSSAYRRGEKPLSSINDIRSAVYKMNNRGPNSDPWGKPNVRRTFDELSSRRRTYFVRPSRYDWNHRWTMSWMPKVTRRCWSKISRWMQLIGPGGPVQLNYHGRPLAGCQTILARQQFQSNDLVENRTVAAVEDQRTLNNLAAGEQRGVWVASTAPTGSKSVDTDKRLWCRAPASWR